MVKKNKYILGIIIVSLFLLTFGGSYAYFSILFNDERTEEGNTTINTSNISSSTVVANVPNSSGNLLSANIYPGHKEVIALSIDVRGSENSSSSYQFVYHITENGFNDNIKVSLYRGKEDLNATSNYFNCEKQAENIEGNIKYYETCEEKKVGSLLDEVILNGGEEDKILGYDTITLQTDGTKTRYYYIVIEFINKDESQNEVMNKVLDGHIEVELIPYKEVLLEGTDYLEELAENSAELMYDETVDNNLRYIGSNPNNYVSFNNELWRIIGVMNNIDDGTGNKESRIKIIRSSILYSNTQIHSNYTVNNWANMNMKNTLNTTYLNGIEDSSKEMIDEVQYPVGGTTDNNDQRTSLNFYTIERGNKYSPWIGKIALPYPSDFGFAAGNSDVCKNYYPFTYANNYRTQCAPQNWLTLKALNERLVIWTMTSGGDGRIGSGIRVWIYRADSVGSYYGDSNQKYSVLPVLFLKPDVVIKGGNGSSTSPFELSM